MATGYTEYVADGTITDLRAFALLCVRHTGILGFMRDMPLDAPIPDIIEADFSHQLKDETTHQSFARRSRVHTPICLISYGESDLTVLESFGLPGRLVLS